MKQHLIVNMASESDESVKAHGVHTAYDEIASALEARSDVTLIRGELDQQVKCDIVHLHTIGPKVWKKLRQKNAKVVVSAHVVPASFIGSLVLAKYWRFAARWYMRWFYGKADKVLAVSGMVAESLENELGVDKSKIQVFYNSINMSGYGHTDEDCALARKELSIHPKEFVVVGNGQVQPRKRLDVFVSMARALPSVKFIWIGGIPFKRLGADYVAMQDLMQHTPQNFVITGVIDHAAVRDYLIAADVFCLPAEQENHPMCVLEAAGAGLPIVLRDIPEYDDTFKSDVIRCNDDTFTEEIEKLQNDPIYYKRWQTKAKAVRERFDSKNAAAELIEIYKELL